MKKNEKAGVDLSLQKISFLQGCMSQINFLFFFFSISRKIDDIQTRARELKLAITSSCSSDDLYNLVKNSKNKMLKIVS